MTPTPARQPQEEYIITEEELCGLEIAPSKYLLKNRIKEIRATHTSPPALEVDPKYDYKRAEAAYHQGYAAGAKAAREQVLDAIQDHNDGRLKGMDILFATPSNERTESAQDVYLKEAYFELTLVKHLIESLRAQQAGEP